MGENEHQERYPAAVASDPPQPTTRRALDATIAHESSASDTTKEERDLAFAVVALMSGQLNERQLARGLGNWTIHGHRSLADHLVSHGLMPQTERTDLEKEALKWLNEARGSDDDKATQLRQRIGVDLWDRVCRIVGVSSAADTSGEMQPRSTVAEYAILRRLGSGGLGCVWLARDQSLNRLVAIKEVNEQAATSPAALARFRREAEITGQLEHPNIVPVHQFGQDTGRNHPLYVMRFVGKKTLADAISEYHDRLAAGLADTVELHRLLSSFLSVCQAVAFAHSRSVLHRDLKPENIALGNFGQVIVLDWGLAKRTDDGDWYDAASNAAGAGGSTIERTVAGQVLGTPHYMSPEQASGRIESMDERTDVYGLGATLFSILTGYAPHEATQLGSSRSTRGAELYASIVENPTPRVRATAPGVASELDAICAKAMAAAPAARYQSAADLAADIQLWMAGEPVSAYNERWTIRFARTIRKHRVLSLVAVALILAVITAVGIAAYSSSQRQIREQQALMESLYLDGKGLSVNLLGSLDKATNNVRFMSGIPPIQGIIRSRHSDAAGEDSEEVWRGRLETIYSGLLQANPEYVSVAYASLGDQPADIVRVERSPFDRWLIRAAPPPRLATVPAEALERQVVRAKPGDVRLSDLLAPANDASVEGNAETGADPLTLKLAVPVMDEQTGELFGAVTIEVDLEYLFQQWLHDVKGVRVILADHDGAVIAGFLPDAGRHRRTDPLIGRELLPRDFVTKAEGDLRQWPNDTHPHGLYATKVYFDPQRSGRFVCLVLEGLR